MNAFSNFARVAEVASARLAALLSNVAALAVAAIVVILSFSAVQRYVLASPWPATEEIAAYLFVTCTFLSMMDGLTQGRHIRLLPVWRRLPPRFQGWAMVAGHAGALAVLALIIRQTYDFAASSRAFGARSYVADLVEWPWMMLIPFSLAALAFAILARLLGDIDRNLRGEPPPEAGPNGPEAM